MLADGIEVASYFLIFCFSAWQPTNFGLHRNWTVHAKVLTHFRLDAAVFTSAGTTLGSNGLNLKTGNDDDGAASAAVHLMFDMKKLLVCALAWCMQFTATDILPLLLYINTHTHSSFISRQSIDKKRNSGSSRHIHCAKNCTRSSSYICGFS